MFFKLKRIIFPLFAMFFCISVFAQEETSALAENVQAAAQSEQMEQAEAEPQKPTLKNGLTATAETLGSNILLAGFNRFVLRMDFAKISPESIKDNLTHCWVWDQDEFVVNQLGHPYQGSFYFAAGRANNFNFYESLGYTMLGSVTWEYFAETERQSVNDLICTTFGGAMLGEAFHRLYIEAAGAKSIFAFVVSPMDAVNSLITKSRPVRGTKEGVTSFEDFIRFGGVAENSRSEEKTFSDNEKINGNIGGGFSVVYGNPFRNEKSVPFSYFNFDLEGGGTVKYYQVKTNIEGNLFRLGTKYTEKSSFSAMLAATFNVDWTKLSSYSANGLGILLHSRSEFENGFSLAQKLNLSGTFFAAGDCYPLYRGHIKLPDDGVERRLYDYGTGFYGRYDFTVNQKYFGKLNLNAACLEFFDIETAVPSYAKKGATFIVDTGISYKHVVKKNVSLGLDFSYYFKHENNYGAENSDENIFSANLFLSRKIK